ncbi:hypothetical protein [Hymenobacter convexus]|uniref:hypothetical protein n=1 Tax=Hymenobacter sp. CA1UV-4 TaxID=3063782 RepID=UPI002712890E|nr:hypothetical protein [Hymenobacter sp. CA1UV-4]MDO7850362.1 hypothetical protein [Hymenobacter sp. CA1UV-4]
MALLSLSAHAQKTTEATAGGPSTTNCLPSFYASQASICQGGSAVLQFGPNPCDLSTTYTYAWAPNRNISSATSPSVVVNPLVTTTYTLTASTGAVNAYSTTITVQANCCQYAESSPKVVELGTNYTFDYNLAQYAYGDPFQYDFSTSPPMPRAPGTVFHVGGGTLTLHGNAYRLPVGGVLLMGPNADVVLDDAQLYLEGATITAACDEMWGGLVHPGSGHGLFAKAVGTLSPRLMHSRRGLTFTRDATAPASTNALFLSNLEFLHNYRALTLDYSASPAPTREYVRFCTFDADPQLLKIPYAPISTSSSHAPTHVRVLGDARALRFRQNTLQRALVGLTLAEPGVAMQADTCAWVDFQLAGIASQGTPDPKNAPSRLGVTSGKFVFPTATKHPGTGQVTQALADYSPALYTDATLGIGVVQMPVSVTGAAFRQDDTTPYASFGYANYRTEQIGVRSQNLTLAQGNTFRALGVGLALEVPANTATDVERNLFSECAKGFSLLSGSGQVLADCNTFERGVSLSARSGVSYGIINESASTIRLEDPNVQPGNPATVLKNRFDDTGTSNSGFYALYNNAPVGMLSYYSYKNYSQLTLATLVNPSVSLTFTNTTPDYVSGTACVNLTPNGLQRNGASLAGAQPATNSSLAQNTPNPTHGSTTIAYRLPKGAQSATLLVRRALDARVVETLSLDTSRQELRPDATRYPAGTYFYTLLVDGAPIATHRLVVE